jgi:hypothetical protein
VRRGGLFSTFSSRQALLAPSLSSTASLRSCHQHGTRAVTPGRLRAGPPLYASVSEPVLDHDAACGVAAHAYTGSLADEVPPELCGGARAAAAASHAAASHAAASHAAASHAAASHAGSTGHLPSSKSLSHSSSPATQVPQPARPVARSHDGDGAALAVPAADASRLRQMSGASQRGKRQLSPLPSTALAKGTRPRSAGILRRSSVSHTQSDASALLRAVRRSPSTRRLAASSGALAHAPQLLVAGTAHATGAAGRANTADVIDTDAPADFVDLAPPLQWELPRVDLLSHRPLSADTPSMHRRAEHAATRQAQLLNERSGRSHVTLPHAHGSGGRSSSSTQSLGTMGSRAASLRHASPQRLRAYTLRREADEPVGRGAASSSSINPVRSAGATPELPPLRFGGARVAAGEPNTAGSGHPANSGDSGSDAATARVYADPDTGVAASTGRTDGASDSARSSSQRRLSLTMALQVKRMARRWSNVPKVRGPAGNGAGKGTVPVVGREGLLGREGCRLPGVPGATVVGCYGLLGRMCRLPDASAVAGCDGLLGWKGCAASQMYRQCQSAALSGETRATWSFEAAWYSFYLALCPPQRPP